MDKEEKKVREILGKLDLEDMLVIIKYIYALEQRNEELEQTIRKLPNNIKLLLEDE